MSRPQPIIQIQTPSLEFPGRPGVTAKQTTMLQAEFFTMKAVERTTWSYRHTYPLVVQTINKLQTEIATEGLATDSGREGLAAFMFEDAFAREYFKTVQLNFFAMFSEWHSVWMDLTSNIAHGLTYEPIGSEVNSAFIEIPEEIYSRTLGTKDTHQWLLANRWAVVMIMVKMWGVVPDAV